MEDRRIGLHDFPMLVETDLIYEFFLLNIATVKTNLHMSYKSEQFMHRIILCFFFRYYFMYYFEIYFFELSLALCEAQCKKRLSLIRIVRDGPRLQKCLEI